MADRPAPPKPSLSQQLLRSFRPKAIAPLASAATASPAQRPVDHQIQDSLRSTAALPVSSSSTATARQLPANPFEIPSSPPSPVQLPLSTTRASTSSASAATTLAGASPSTATVASTPADELRAHLVEFAKPLPLSEPARSETIKDRCARIYNLSRLTKTANPPPPQGQVLRLVVAILDGRDDEQFPPPIREAACRLLTDAIEHSDERAKTSLKAVIETRSGAPGSQSSKSLDSDQPLANIDRALFYRLVVEERQHDIACRSHLPSKDDLSATALPALHAKLRVLEALSKGGKEVVAFEGIVELLATWLSIVWREIQVVRQLAPLVHVPRPQDSQDGSGDSAHPLDPSIYAQELSSREWSLQAILHLLTSIVTFNFARVNQQHIQHALKIAATLFIEPVPHSDLVDLGEAATAAAVASSRWRSSIAGTRKESPSTAASMGTSKSQSRERRKRAPSTEGYSYYGTETLTPESGPSSVASPASTPHLGPRQSSSVSATPAAPLPPPIATALSQKAPSRLSSIAYSETSGANDDSSLPVYPELDDLEVRAVVRLLDATFKFGYMPPPCVPFVARMLCRVLGYETIAWTLSTTDGLAQLAKVDAVVGTPWQLLVRNFLGQTLLRSHSANSSIQVVRSLLVLPSPGKRPEEPVTRPIEDEAVLVGAVSFLRFALHSTGQDAATNAAPSGSGSAPAQTAKEDALLARFSVSLLLPALRGALLRESDILDLQVLSLVGDVLIPAVTSAKDSAGDSSGLPLGNVRTEEWDQLLQLTMLSQRHVLDWHASLVANQASRAPLILMTLVNLLARLPLASPDQIGSAAQTSQAGEEQGNASTTDAKRSHLLAWTPRLCTLMMTLAPALPGALAEALITYHLSHHLCLPCTPDWISNLRRLLDSFLGVPSVAGNARTKDRLVHLVFDHVYDSVVSFPEHRSLLLREIVLPMARSLLLSEKDISIADRARKVLVQSAALSSAAAPGAEGEGDYIFDRIRKLLVETARTESAALDNIGHTVPRHGSDHHHHVHFAEDATSQEDRSSPEVASGSHDSDKETKASETSNATSQAAARQVRSALDLISIFNLIAFSSPWVDFEDANDLRESQELKAREGCVALFRDLMSLIQPNSSGGEGSKEGEPGSQGKVSSRAKLAILEWFLRIRTDLHHRVFLIWNLDEQIAPSAAIILKTPESKAAAMAAEASAANSEKARQARTDAREGGRRGTVGDIFANRSKSRAREASRERERDAERGRAADRSNDSRARTDRSSSAARGTSGMPKKPAAEHESLWQVPQTISFEMPPTMLRSDIVYTYIHTDDPSCSHDHPLPIGKHPLPLPVSALLETYIKIIATERDWELVSYLICHMPPQLSNKHLFCGPKAQVQVVALRQYLCSSILQQKLMADVTLPDSIKRSDVYAVIYSTLTTLLSYRALFTRANQDEMVEAFIAGLNKSQNTAQPCVRALAVAVYEAQKSVTRLLPTILVKLSTIMSSMTMSVHILELIASIAQIPACYANFTEAEYRRVFGIALQYIQYHESPAASAREDFRSSPASFTLSQYVMMLAYYNISVWFMTLRLSDRPKHVPSITRGLLLANEGLDKMSDQSEVCFDFMARFTHSNADPKPKRSFMNSVIMGPNSASASRTTGGKDPDRVSKTWLVGKGLLTISALRKEGWVEVVVRRASGTTAMLCKLENAAVSVLPDEDGERVDLPAALMMRRDPEMIGKPILRAPSGGVYSRRHEPEAADEVSESGEKSLAQEAKALLKASDHMRARGPTGPAHFGLAAKPRAASFSGPVAASTLVRSSREDGPYSSPSGGANQVGEGKDDADKVEEAHQTADDRLRLKAGEETIAKVMEDILNEGSKLSPDQPSEAQQQPSGDKSQDSEGSREEKPGTAQPSPIATKPAFQPVPKQSVDRDAAVDPSTIALQLSAYPDFPNQPMVLLPDEPATTRLIKAIDLTPVVDLHKIGCLYVGPGQKTEAEILGNLHGSPAFAQFLSGLGDLITLKNQEDMYTGGLDRETDLHGKYAYAWSDDISQIVFHTATMMPNRAEDPSHSFKKALIGNDWVHIVFNESGEEYKFGTLPSQFNYANIVISPTTKGGTALGSIGKNDTIFYRVSLQRREGLPSFSPVGDGQLVSYDALPVFVRSLALNANVLSQIYNDTGESMQPYSSNWCNRLNHVVRYKGQLEAKRRKKEQEAAEQNPAYIPGATVGQDPRDFTAYA